MSSFTPINRSAGGPTTTRLAHPLVADDSGPTVFFIPEDEPAWDGPAPPAGMTVVTGAEIRRFGKNWDGRGLNPNPTASHIDADRLPSPRSRVSARPFAPAVPAPAVPAPVVFAPSRQRKPLPSRRLKTTAATTISGPSNPSAPAAPPTEAETQDPATSHPPSTATAATTQPTAAPGEKPPFGPTPDQSKSPSSPSSTPSSSTSTSSRRRRAPLEPQRADETDGAFKRRKLNWTKADTYFRTRDAASHTNDPRCAPCEKKKKACVSKAPGTSCVECTGMKKSCPLNTRTKRRAAVAVPPAPVASPGTGPNLGAGSGAGSAPVVTV